MIVIFYAWNVSPILWIICFNIFTGLLWKKYTISWQIFTSKTKNLGKLEKLQCTLWTIEDCFSKTHLVSFTLTVPIIVFNVGKRLSPQSRFWWLCSMWVKDYHHNPGFGDPVSWVIFGKALFNWNLTCDFKDIVYLGQVKPIKSKRNLTFWRIISVNKFWQNLTHSVWHS